MIRIVDLTVQFGGVRPLDDLTAELDAPIAGLIGPNGAGKTTLLNVLSGFVTPIAGRIEVDGVDILSLSPPARARFGLRRTFQTEQVVDDLSAYDNVQAVLDHVDHDRRSARASVERALDHVGLGDFGDRMGDTLNLFQRRMLELAKALVGAPRLALMDEPAAGLTDAESAALRAAILGVPEHFGAHVLLIDHDVNLIRSTCAQTLVLDFGRRLALGETAAVLDDPAVRRAYLGAA